MSPMLLHCRFPRARVPLAAALAFAASCTVLVAQTPASKPPPSIGEKLSAAIMELRPLQEAKDWTTILARLDRVPDIKPGSYDHAILLDMKARTYGAMEQPEKTIAPWEQALQLSDEHGYFPERQTLEIVLLLAQIHGREAAMTKDTARQQEHFEKSVKHFRRYLAHTPKPPPEVMVNYTSILFYKATANPSQLDTATITEAKSIIERGLTTAVKPREEFYQLLLGVMQQEHDLLHSSELLELLLKQKPQNKDYWQALASIYLQLGDKAKDTDPILSREYLVRAIVTFERARAFGFLNTPKDNLQLATFHLMANQFTRGTEMLYAGLKNGTIESEPNNWRLLGRFYQEAYMNKEAIAVLKEAVTLFPQNGEIEMQLAQLHLQTDDMALVLQHAKAAAAKGNFETVKPFAVQHLIAHAAYVLGQLEDAQAAIAEAEKFPADAAKDPQFPRLKEAIRDSLTAREIEAAKSHEKKPAPAEKKSA